MRRREFIAGLGGAAWPLVGRAQQSKVPVVRYIGGWSVTDGGNRAFFADFLQGLAEAGYVEGRNVAIEYRWVESHNERLPGLVNDLVSRRVAVMAVVDSTAAVLAAKTATQSIPIVFVVGGDPIASVIVPNLNRPGGNITGVTTRSNDLGAKRLELLCESLPAGVAVALLTNPSNANAVRETAEIQAAARQLGVRLVTFNTTTPDDIEAAFRSFAGQKIGGLMTANEPLLYFDRHHVIALAAGRAFPTIYTDRLFVEAGGLMSYGASGSEAFRLAGVYTGRALSGEKPANLPVQQYMKVELALNLKTAKALGIDIPTVLLVRADEVIE
jgi:putative tryptophan/tyrosine transport system substrate-binding protein